MVEKSDYDMPIMAALITAGTFIGILLFFVSKDKVLEIMLGSLLAFIGVSFGFFTYGTYIEKQIVHNQVNSLINEIVNEIKSISPELVQALKPLINNLQAPDMSKADLRVEEQNNAILKKTLKVTLIMSITILVIALIIYVKWRDTIDLGHVLKSTGISFLSVAVTYFLFLTFITKNYQPIDPNFVRRRILEIIKSSGNLTPAEKDKATSSLIGNTKSLIENKATSFLGNNATSFLGNNATSSLIGNNATSSLIGNNAISSLIGNNATSSLIGNNATSLIGKEKR